jgi:hypothetical protein
MVSEFSVHDHWASLLVVCVEVDHQDVGGGVSSVAAHLMADQIREEEAWDKMDPSKEHPQ